MFALISKEAYGGARHKTVSSHRNSINVSDVSVLPHVGAKKLCLNIHSSDR